MIQSSRALIFVQSTNTQFKFDASILRNERKMLKKLLGLIPQEKEKLYEYAKKQVAREAFLRKITETVRSSLDVNEIINLVCREIPEIFNVQRVVITDFTQINGGRFHATYYNTQKDIKNGTSLPIAKQSKIYGYAREVIIEKDNNFIINNLLESDAPEYYKKIAHELGVKATLGVAIKDENRTWGAVFIVDCNKYRQWTDEEIILLETIANKISIAIRQAELYSQTKKQAEREKIIREITAAAGSSLNPEEIQNKLVMMVAQVYKPDKCFIRPFNRELDKFTSVNKYAEYFSSNDLNKEYCFSDEVEALVKSEYKEGNAFIVPDFEEFLKKPEPFKSIGKRQIEHYKILANYCFPIIIENELFGAFILQFKEKTYLEPEDVNLLKIIVDHAAISLKQAESFITTKKQSEREAFLRKITEAVRSSLDINEILDLVCKEVSKIFNVQRVIISDYTRGRDGRVNISNYNTTNKVKNSDNLTTDEQVMIFEFVRSIVVGKDINLVIDNILKSDIPEYHKKIFNKLGIKSVLAVAIKHKDRPWRGLYIAEYNKYRHWTNEEITLLEIIANQISMAIRQAELYSQTKKQAERELLLRETIQTVRGSLNINKIKEELVNHVGKAFKADKCFFWDYDNKNKKFISEIKFDYVTSPDLKKPYTYGKKTDDFLIEMYKKQGYIYIEDFSKLTDEPGHMGIISRNQTEYHKIKTNCCFGLFDGNRFLGAFAIQYKELTQICDEDIELLKSIVNQASIAIRQVNQHQRIQKQAEHEFILRKITEAIRNYLDINQIKQSIVNETGKIFDADRCLIRLWDNCTHSHMMVEQSAEYLKSKAIKSIVDIEPSEEFQNYLIKIFDNKENLYAPDLENLDKEKEAVKFLKSFDVKSAYACPIHKDNSPVGFVIIQFTKSKVILEDEDIELLKTIASQSGLAIKQANLYTKTKIQAERADFLRKIIETVGGSLDSETLLNTICKEIFELFKPDRVSIETYPNKDAYTKWSVTTQYTSGSDILGVNDIEYSMESKEYLGIKTLEEGSDIISDDIEKSGLPDYFIDTHKKMGVKSYIAVPLKRDNDKWGVLALSQVHNYRKWTKGEIQLLHTVAEQAYIAIRQAELYTKSQEAARSKSEFITNISHEIRTPLNSIIGFSQLLNSPDCVKEKQQKYLNNISLSANHLLELINSVLNFSKIESGEMFLCLEKFDSASIIREIVLSIKSMAIQKNITINTKLCEVILEADLLKFKQILLNLLSNAIKFTKENGQVTLRTKFEKNELIVEVEDTGIGISEKDRDKIFEYFSQIDSSHSRNQEGTGLGLVLTKKLVELHNGKIGFESQKGKGSKFWFILPKAKVLSIQKV